MKLFSKSLMALALGATLAGCGGGNGLLATKPGSAPNPTSVPPGVALTGKTATRAILASGYQSFHAAINYPYAGIQLALPASSPFRESKSNRTKSVANLNETSAALFNPDLNLYQTVSTSANVTTIKFYSDAALTKSAGNSVLTAPANATVGGNYARYPAVVKITQNITAGNIPCQGSGAITFTGGSGANKLNGTLSLPKTGLNVTANLTLSDSGQVGGSTTIVGNGQTITLSGLSGQLDGDLTGKANVLPDKTTGTGVVNVVTGKFQITLDTPQGTATGVGNPDGSLGIHFPDGLAETLASPFTVVGGQDPNAPTATATPSAKPTATPKPGPTATPGPTAAPGTSVYNAPVKIQGVTRLLGLNNQNHFIAGGGGTTGIRFYSSPSDSGKTLVGSASTTIGATAFNDGDMTLGSQNLASPPNAANALFWSSPSAALATLKPFVSGSLATYANAINDSGQIVGGDLDGHGLYWSSPTATPIALQNFMSSSGFPSSASALNSTGEIMGTSGGITLPLYWSSATAIPRTLPLLAAPNGLSYSVYRESINTESQIFIKGNTGFSSFYASPSTQPVQLPFLPGARAVVSNYYGAASMNDHNVVVGVSPQVQGQPDSAVRWLTTGGKIQVQDINTLIPANSGWHLDEADFINNNGTIVGQGTLNGVSTAFYLTPR